MGDTPRLGGVFDLERMTLHSCGAICEVGRKAADRALAQIRLCWKSDIRYPGSVSVRSRHSAAEGSWSTGYAPV